MSASQVKEWVWDWVSLFSGGCSSIPQGVPDSQAATHASSAHLAASHLTPDAGIQHFAASSLDDGVGVVWQEATGLPTCSNKQHTIFISAYDIYTYIILYLYLHLHLYLYLYGIYIYMYLYLYIYIYIYIYASISIYIYIYIYIYINIHVYNCVHLYASISTHFLAQTQRTANNDDSRSTLTGVLRSGGGFQWFCYVSALRMPHSQTNTTLWTVNPGVFPRIMTIMEAVSKEE